MFSDTGFSRFRDSAFTKNKHLPVHRWIPWIAGFSSGFVDDCIHEFLSRKRRHRCCVLDPFAGVGTTLVAAVTAGHDAVGFEINPYAALASRAKLGALHLDIRRLDAACKRYEYLSRNGSRTGSGRIPDEFVTRIPFFSPAVQSQVFGFQDFLRRIKDAETADVFRLAFGAVMVSFSNYTYEPSLCSRPGAGKPLIEQADVHAGILRKLAEIRSDIRWLQNETPGRAAGTGQVHEMNFMDAARVLPAGTIDLAVTSPPYMNNYHYVRSTRPQLFWLKLVDSRADLRELTNQNIGKYWQAVRDAPPVSLAFEDRTLETLLSTIRSTRTDKGAYGGPGWANYVATYLNDTYRFLGTLKRCLARGAHAVIVIGNSIIQGHEVKVDRILADTAERIGLRTVGIELLRTKRVGASITNSTVRRGQKSKATLYESAVILRKK